MLKFFVHTGFLKTNAMHWKLYVTLVTVIMDWNIKTLYHFKNSAVTINQLVTFTATSTDQLQQINQDIVYSSRIL